MKLQMVIKRDCFDGKELIRLYRKHLTEKIIKAYKGEYGDIKIEITASYDNSYRNVIIKPSERNIYYVENQLFLLGAKEPVITKSKLSSFSLLKNYLKRL